MFLGTHHPKLDEKGRFFLPAKFREELSAGLVMCKGQEHCVTIYTEDEFRAVVTKTASGPSTVKQVRDYQRILAASAANEVPDKQGRITVPPALRGWARLDKEIVVVGAIDRVEIWDAAVWEKYSVEQESAFADMNDEVFPGLGGE